MEVIRRVRSMKEICRQTREHGRRVGFVPTMGALHEGHLALFRRTRELCDVLVVSIFVNPTQFGPQEDFDGYPRDLAADVDLCIGEQVDYVFAPEAAELYPPGCRTFVEVAELGSRFEGASRPGHFRGVATVVLKLFEVVRPAIAAFGQKDAQQATIVRRMVRDLLLDVEMLVLPTVRDADGLALSSRNRHLSPEERRAALAIPRALSAVRDALVEGQRAAEGLVAAARKVLESEELVSVDYVELVDREELEPVARVDREALLVVAARVGTTRLLDNVVLWP